MPREQQPTRTFVKNVDGEKQTRIINSAQGEVQALFDGFVEESTSSAKSSTSGASRSSSSSS